MRNALTTTFSLLKSNESPRDKGYTVFDVLQTSLYDSQTTDEDVHESSDVLEAYLYLYLDRLKYLPVSDSKDIIDIETSVHS